ncbi:MAG: ABC transporter permease [Rhodospirillaceae bacterium]|nr:ABC transporter permease [Rhodospirillaceae bacterium]
MGYVINRLLQGLTVIAVMAVLVFIGVYAIGNPVDMLISPEADQAEIAATIARLGLDKPLWEQFLAFVNGVLHGDLGTSFIYNEPAVRLILERFPATMELALAAILIAVVIGIPLGIVAGLKPDHPTGRSIMAVSILGFSLPTFWVGMMLIMIFAVWLGWLPSTGRGDTVEFLGVQVSFLTVSGLRHLILPAVNLALFKTSLVIRLSRAGTREVIGQDYIKFARAKGLSETRVILVHLLKNMMIPVVTVLGLEFGSVVAFAVVTETVFSWPGIGKLLIGSIVHLDRPVIVAYLMLTVMLFVTINFIVDMIYAALDPRVRRKESA